MSEQTQEPPQRIESPVTVTVSKIGGATEEIAVREFTVREFKAAFALHAAEDEAGLVALSADKPAAWCDSLTPSSFEHAAEALRLVNQPFFARATRTLAQREVMRSVGTVIRGAALSGRSG